MTIVLYLLAFSVFLTALRCPEYKLAGSQQATGRVFSMFFRAANVIPLETFAV